MRVPTIHMNGTAPEQLLEQLMDAYRAVGTAMRALDEAAPNGRDYYIQGPDAVQEATSEHRRRAEKLRSVHAELEELVMSVQDQIDVRQARRNPSPTKTLYRAAHDATVTAGTCFAEDIDDAIEYQDNPGFGGPNLYSLEVTPTYKTFVESLEDARDQIADAIVTHGWPSGVRRPRELDDEVELTKEDLVAWLEDVFSGYESGHAHVHDVVADTPWVVDLLGQSYDWVVFKDSFPEDCITWCYVGDDDLEDGMSLIDAQ